MRDMAGCSYGRSLTITFIPEFLSMNLLMSGMVVIVALGRAMLGEVSSPVHPVFWFIMSMALLVGFGVAYPMNWWLVANGLKHGMMTVRPRVASERGGTEMMHHDDTRVAGHADTRGASPQAHPHGHDQGGRIESGSRPSPAQIARMAALSILVFALAIWTALGAI